MTTRNDWVHAFLAADDFPPAGDNLLAVLTWVRSEFGGDHPIPAKWNPLATTRAADGASDYNSVGVKDYPTFAEGVAACAQTLMLNEPGYAAIRGCLAQQTTPEETIAAIHNSAWGSKPDLSMLTYVRSHLETEMLLEVGEADDTHVPGPPPPAPPFPGVLLRDFTDGHGTATWQQQMAKRGWTIAVDDKYGPQSEHVCREFQAEKGLEVDGVVGTITWGAAWTAPIT